MYITHPSHWAGARPSKTQAPTAPRLTTSNADQCVHQPREGRGRNRQTSPQTKGGRARDGPTARKPPTHTTRGGQTPGPDSTEDGTHGAPQRNTGGPPSQNWRHPTERSGKAEERTPRTRPHTPRWGRDGQIKKLKAQPERKEKGGRRPPDPRPGQPATYTTKPRHDRAKNRTPPQPEKNTTKEEGGGQTPPTATPAHSHATGGPPQKVTGNGSGAHKKPRAPAPKPGKNRRADETKTHTHTHTSPPGMAG